MATPILEILSQGDEIITGQVVDTNAAWLSQQAVDLGFEVTWHSAVGDQLTHLINVLKDISVRADCCICTGGLGPTTDDLTAEAVAAAFSLALEFDPIAFEQMRHYFIHRNRTMPECNRKQAMLPKGSKRLTNAVGTAPGFAIRLGRCWFAFLPGVPSEMRTMFNGEVLPLLQQQFALAPARLIIINTLGIGESDIQQRLTGVVIPREVRLGFRAMPSEVQVKLLFPADYPLVMQTKLTNDVAEAIGEHVFAIGEINKTPTEIIGVIDQLVSNQGHTITLLETLSRGLVANRMEGFDWLQVAAFYQSPTTLASAYGVSVSIDVKQLSVSMEVLCRAVQAKTGSSLVLCQLPLTDVTTALGSNYAVQSYTGLLVHDKFFCMERALAGNSTRKQNQAAITLFDIMRKYL
jgi:nicotinamide-nucleotide amidase